jgi:Rieske Fe-S protein
MVMPPPDLDDDDQCQCHGSRFDLVTRAVISGPPNDALNVHEAHEVEGGIRIRA